MIPDTRTLEEEDFVNNTPNLSALLQVGRDDLCNIINQIKFGKINMEIDQTSWHSIGFNRACIVCLAGAVMDQTLNMDREKTLLPEDASYQVERRLNALDSLRSGEVQEAVGCFYNDEDPDTDVYENFDEAVLTPEGHDMGLEDYNTIESLGSLDALIKKLKYAENGGK